MNTNDFYKELFEKYALDEEKIRRNAIKAAKTPAWQRAVGAHWKSVAGAAAAVAVTVGAVAYTAGQTAPGTIDIVSSDTLLSASQRLQIAEQDYYNTTSEAEGVADMYVTFIESLCYSDMAVSFSALPDSDDIDIECLYLNDGTVIRGKEAIEAYAEAGSDTKDIVGAKLRAPLRYFRDINDLSKVYRAERGSEDLNDDTFVPIEDEDPLKNANDTTVTTTAAPTETTLPFSFEKESSTSASETAEITHSSDISSDTTQPPDEDEDDPEYVETTDDQQTDDEEPVEGDENAESDITTTAVSDEPAESSETTTSEMTVTSEEFSDVPELGLMTQIYQLNVENALETILVKDYAVVLTRGEAYVYKLGGILNAQATVYEISNPKAAYTDDDTIILTGCAENGSRNILITIDLGAGLIYKNDAGSVIGSAEIGTIHSTRGGYIMKAVSESDTYLYELSMGDNGLQFRPLFEFNGAVSLAGYKNGKLWFTAADENLKYSLYAYDGAAGIIKSEYELSSVCKVRRSKSFESFLISTTDSETGEPKTYVFDASTGSLAAVDISGDALIADRRGTIFVGFDGKNYTVASDGTLTETSVPVLYASKPESGYGIVSADSEKVIVAEKSKWKN